MSKSMKPRTVKQRATDWRAFVRECRKAVSERKRRRG